MAKKRTQKKTHAEFLSWLEGVESMQEENWIPNQQQWKTIREMLNNVKPDVKEVNKPAAQQKQDVPVAQVVSPQGMPVQQQFIPPAASGFDTAPLQPAPPRQPQMAPRPSGVDPARVPKGGKGNVLDPGEPHQDNEFV